VLLVFVELLKSAFYSQDYVKDLLGYIVRVDKTLSLHTHTEIFRTLLFDVGRWLAYRVLQAICYPLTLIAIPSTGVNAAGDAGDTSPPIFWLGGTSMGISPPILLRTFRYRRPILVALAQ